MLLNDEIRRALGSMILSASGWRGVFAADGGEESKSSEISQTHSLIAAGAAHAFANFLMSAGKNCTPLVLAASDTRPTGRAVSQAIIRALLSCGCDVKWAGFTAAPEIMAWAQRLGTREARPVGFIYISASHNPVGHNGIKFGLTDGGVLPPEQSTALISDFKSLMDDPERVSRLEQSLRGAGSADTERLAAVYSGEASAKDEALAAYFDCINAVAWAQPQHRKLKNKKPRSTAVRWTAWRNTEFLIQKSSCLRVTPCNSVVKFIRYVMRQQPGALRAMPDPLSALKSGIAQKPLGLVCDFNGSARSVSIDRRLFASLGIGFEAINEKPGEIAHRIVPEGESLEPCMRFLEEVHCRAASFVLGYTPDCDGDRGNLVIWDESLSRPRILEAQEVFALACVAELSQLAWTGELSYDGNGSALCKAAVAVNDATSLRIDRVAAAFGVSLFRAETGEANVVGLARRLRENGYLVRILGEGSAGGNITHPQAVRDPLNTALALIKLLAIRSVNNRPGLFELWCRRSHQSALYRDDFTLSDIIASLPPFATTGAYEGRAILKVKTVDHGLLKERYQRVFLREWDRRAESLRANYGIYKWEAAAYNGMEEKRGLRSFSDAGRGGLRIYFTGSDGKAVASIWMRGSATEPVFRVMADVEGRDTSIEQELIEWQRRMVCEADENQQQGA